MRPSAWLHRYRWRIAIILGAGVVGFLITWLPQMAIAYPELVVGLIAGAFAWGQWHVSRQNLILGLFDKRSGVYQEFRSATGEVLREGHLHEESWNRLVKASYRMEYLFGADVRNHLERIRELGLEIRRDRRALDNQRLPEGQARADVAASHERLMNLYDKAVVDLYDLTVPYLRMDQRLPPNPWQWSLERVGWLKRKWDEWPTGE